MMIQRNRIWIQQSKRLFLLFHMGKALYHELFHDSLSGVLRISTDTCDKSYLKNFSIDIHFQWINCKLGNQCIPIKTSQYIRTFQYREL